jgi:hypothetical protein
VLRAASETETTQEDIQDWLELDEGGPGFQLLTEEEVAAGILLFFHLHCSCLFSKFFGLLEFTFASLIRIIA